MNAKRVIPRLKQTPFRVTFMRKYRKKANKTLEEAGEVVGLSHAQLGRIERGLQPYNQALLEALSDLYGTTPASMLMRDPDDKDNIWSLWDKAQEADRIETTNFLEFRVNKARTGT